MAGVGGLNRVDRQGADRIGHAAGRRDGAGENGGLGCKRGVLGGELGWAGHLWSLNDCGGSAAYKRGRLGRQVAADCVSSAAPRVRNPLASANAAVYITSVANYSQYQHRDRRRMFVSLIIVFREAMEAGLIVGVVLAATNGGVGRAGWIAGGSAAGVAGASLVAAFAGALSNAVQGTGQETFTATILLFAVAMLTWHI